MELWHSLSSNTWLYAISKKTSIFISCYNLSFDITDLNLNGIKILELNSGCKGYIFLTVIYSSSNSSANHTNFVPKIDIFNNDFCICERKILKTKSIKINPITLNNLNLNELRHSQHKLDQFERILDQNMNKSYFFPNVFGFLAIIAISVILCIILLILCCCCNFFWLPIIGKFFPKYPQYCGLPNVCITNHNERFELTDRQFSEMSLRRIRDLNKEDWQ